MPASWRGSTKMVSGRGSPLHCPFRAGCREDLEAVRAAYSELLDRTAAGDATADVATIAKAHGLGKTPRPWSGERGRRELHRLQRAGWAKQLRLDCGEQRCSRRRCHAHAVAAWLTGGWIGWEGEEEREWDGWEEREWRDEALQDRDQALERGP